MTEQIRVTEINFKDITFEIDFFEGESEEEIIKKAHQILARDFTKLIKDRVDVKVLPPSCLTPKNAFIGRIVKVTPLNKTGIILKINRQSQRSVTVLFKDGSTQIFYYHELVPSQDNVNCFHLLMHPFKKGDTIKEHQVYPVHERLATITFQRSRKHRATIHYLTNGTEPIKKTIDIEQLENLITKLDSYVVL